MESGFRRLGDEADQEGQTSERGVSRGRRGARGDRQQKGRTMLRALEETRSGGKQGRDRMRRDDNRLTKAVVIIIACVCAAMMVAVECMLLPSFGWVWIILLLFLAGAAGYAVWTIIRIWTGGRR